MKRLLITNGNYPYHYEILESIIVNCFKILNINEIAIDIYLHIRKNNSFKKYINDKYPNVKFQNTKVYDYYINSTIYENDLKQLETKKDSNKKYISHRIDNRMQSDPNVYFLTPLSKTRYFYADILPYFNCKVTSDKPIYIVQGNLNQNRKRISTSLKLKSFFV